ncbi:hypothetical protein E4T39_01753 [Aureobasidium subglaciale]|nr:hypothetical protein E4T39_01753 [Aureobasidium subglaciale]
MSYTLVSLNEFLASKIEKCCIGYKQEPKIRCSNTISDTNLYKATEIWDAIRSGANAAYVERKIHQMQADTIANSWIEEAKRNDTIQSKIVLQNSVAKTASDTVEQADQFISERCDSGDSYRQQTGVLSQQQQAMSAFDEAHSDARKVARVDEHAESTHTALQADFETVRSKLRGAIAKTSVTALEVEVMKQDMIGCVAE